MEEKAKLKIPRECIHCQNKIIYIEDIGFEDQGLCNCKKCETKTKNHFKKIFKKRICNWKREKDNNTIHTDCENSFVLLNDDSLKDNGFKYCIYCGGHLKEL